jgi:hypothetical protein
MNKAKQSTIPASAKRIPLRPLALGEHTGHHHSLAVLDETRNIDDVAEMYTAEIDGQIRIYLRVIEEDCVALTHQEHKPQLVPAGEYEVVIQSEVTDWGRSPVQD